MQLSWWPARNCGYSFCTSLGYVGNHMVSTFVCWNFGFSSTYRFSYFRHTSGVDKKRIRQRPMLQTCRGARSSSAWASIVSTWWWMMQTTGPRFGWRFFCHEASRQHGHGRKNHGEKQVTCLKQAQRFFRTRSLALSCTSQRCWNQVQSWGSDAPYFGAIYSILHCEMYIYIFFF